MKRLILILILTLNFQSWAKADDISDFQIEGMSIGDSALDFFSKEEIKKNSKNYYKNKKYTPVEIDNTSNFESYWGVDFAFLSQDSEYKFTMLKGIIDYRNKSMKECKKELKEIYSELSLLFKNWKKQNISTESHSADPTGKSKYTSSSFWSDEGVIAVACTDYSEESGWMDHLSVAIKTKKFNNFLGIAYK